jgi:glutamate racemase
VKVLKDNLKIGVFDSGIGGLTVLKKLLQGFPRGVDFFYFADTARVPYGSKPIETLRGYVGEIFDFFFQLGIDAIVTACNTSDSILSSEGKAESSRTVLQYHRSDRQSGRFDRSERVGGFDIGD